MRRKSFSSGSLEAGETGAQILVNQVGFLAGDSQHAILPATGSERDVKFEIVRLDGAVAVMSAVEKSVGSWNRNCPDDALPTSWPDDKDPFAMFSGNGVRFVGAEPAHPTQPQYTEQSTWVQAH